MVETAGGSGDDGGCPAPVNELHVRVLGAIDLDGQRLAASLERRLLACLAINRARPMRFDTLIDIVWDGHPPKGALNSLMSKISRLRKIMPPDRLVRTANGLQLNLQSAEYDATRFEDHAIAATGTGAQALAAAKEAMALWRGDPFAEFAHDEFAQGEAARLTVLYHGVAERHAELLLELGEVSAALAAAEQFLHTLPYSERLCAIQARSLARLSRTVDALAVIRHFAQRMIDDHGLSVQPELRAVENEILAMTGDGPTAAVVTAQRPAATWPLAPQGALQIVGRSDELSSILADLRSDRLITLTGEAGIGKTRLAAAVAESMAAENEVDPPAAWLDAAGVTSIDAALWMLGCDRRLHGDALWSEAVSTVGANASLLIVDGCEPQIETMTELVRALLASTRLRILATSRTRLGLSDEREVRVGPLRTVGSACDAGSMLQAVCAERRVTVDVDLADEIAAMLDGLPLAIELVGARLAELPSEAIVGTLSDRQSRGELVGGSRLAAEVMRSVDLLSIDARQLFVALSFFPSGASFELIQSVAEPDRSSRHGQSVNPLLELIDSGLVRVVSNTSSDHRYRLLAPIADVGRTIAAGIPEQQFSRRLADTMIAFAEDAISPDRGPDEGDRARRLHGEMENIRAAFRWSLDHREFVLAARLLAALQDEAILRERAELEQWADQLVDIERCTKTQWGARIFGIAANAALLRGDFARSIALAEQGTVALKGGALPTWVIPNVRFLLGASHDLGHLGALSPQRQRHLDDLHEYSELTGDPLGRAMAAFSASYVHAAFGLPEKAIPPAIAAVRLARSANSPTLSAIATYAIANARARYNPEKAVTQVMEAARLARVGGCGVIVRHADRLELDLVGASSASELDDRLTRSIRHINAAIALGHREHALQEIAGVVSPLVRLGRLSEAAKIAGGLERTLWGQTRNVVDARSQLVSLLGAAEYHRLARPSRRLTWRQLAAATCDIADGLLGPAAD